MIKFESNKLYVNSKIIDFETCRYCYERVKEYVENKLLDEECLEYVYYVIEKENNVSMCMDALISLCKTLGEKVKEFLFLSKEKNIPYIIINCLGNEREVYDTEKVINALYKVLSVSVSKSIIGDYYDCRNAAIRILRDISFDTVSSKIINYDVYIGVLDTLLFGDKKIQIDKIISCVKTSSMDSFYNLLMRHYFNDELEVYTTGDKIALLLIHSYEKDYSDIRYLCKNKINLKSIKDIVLSDNTKEIRNVIELTEVIL